MLYIAPRKRGKMYELIRPSWSELDNKEYALEYLKKIKSIGELINALSVNISPRGDSEFVFDYLWKTLREKVSREEWKSVTDHMRQLFSPWLEKIDANEDISLDLAELTEWCKLFKFPYRTRLEFLSELVHKDFPEYHKIFNEAIEKSK